MSFTCDKQTLDDLNLLGKYKPGSVYGLFNCVHTRGGERLLEDFFRHPLTDPGEINRRSAIFLYLQGKAFVFPFDGRQFGLIEDYLNRGAAANRLFTAAGILRQRILEAAVKDEAYGATLNAIQTLVSFIHDCRAFIAGFNESDTANPLREELQSAKKILDDRRLSGLPGLAQVASLSWRSAAGLHHLFGRVLQEDLTRLCGILYYLDLYIAVSSVAREKGFSYAQALPGEDHIIRAADLRHPCLTKAIGNPIALNGGSNVLFLTGANMAGKSTFMKSFGIALYLAHMGFPVAAREMVFSVKKGLYSSINVPDDLSLGYSHFYAEVQRVKKIAEEVSRSGNLVVIFDELFKGTNVKDAYDATLAVTAAFSEYRNCFFVVSTHIIEVGETLRRERDNIQFAFLPTVMEGAVPHYTYKMEEGITADRHGMLIIENERIVEIIQSKKVQ